MDVASSSFDDELLYDDLLDESNGTLSIEPSEDTEAAIASSTLEEIEREEERQQTAAEDEQLNQPCSSTSIGRVVKAEYFRDPIGISKTVTYPVQTNEQYPSYYGVPDAASPSANTESKEVCPLFDDNQHSQQFPSIDKQSLSKLTIKIGEKILRFKIVDAPKNPLQHNMTLGQSVWHGAEPSSSYNRVYPPFPSLPPSNSGPTQNSESVRPSTVTSCAPGGHSDLSAPLYDRRDNGYGFMCRICSSQLGDKESYIRHMSTHKNARPYQCRMMHCSKAFSNKNSLLLHEKHHTTEKPFSCVLCNKTFTRQHNFNIHLKLHQSGRRHFCSCCGKWFRTEMEMVDHQVHQCESRIAGEVIPTDKPLRFKCSFCDKMFHHRRDKNIHERVHTGERPYTCGYCGKGFTQSQALTVHIRTHTGEKPYNCGLCGEAFRDTSGLRKHEFIKHSSIGDSSPYGEIDHIILDEGSYISELDI